MRSVFMGNHFDHFIELCLNLFSEVGLGLITLGELGKDPTPMLLKVIHAEQFLA